MVFFKNKINMNKYILAMKQLVVFRYKKTLTGPYLRRESCGFSSRRYSSTRGCNPTCCRVLLLNVRRTSLKLRWFAITVQPALPF